MHRTFVGMVLVALVAGAPAARAQSRCSIQTVSGTYVYQSGGFSALGSVFQSQVGPTYDTHGGSAVIVGQVTIAPTGILTGTYWGVWVAFPLPPTPIAAHISINPDCTGTITDDETGDVDQIVVIGNGSTIQGMGWTGFGTPTITFRRLARADEPAPRCGQQTLRGTYSELCRGFALDESGGVATATTLAVWNARDGTITGTFREKVFGLPESTLRESEMSGSYTVNSDCTVDLAFASPPDSLTVRARGVLFDQGRRGLGLPLGIYDGDTLVAPMGPLTCDLVRIAN